MRFNRFVSFFEVLVLDAKSEVADCEEGWKFIGLYPCRYQNVMVHLSCFPWGIFDIIREGIWFVVTSSTNGQRESSEQL